MISALLAIALLHWTALITPGPNTLVISNLAANGSRRTAVCAALGVTMVAGIWSTLAVLGVNAIFTAHHHLRMAVQVGGGCYLLYLGLPPAPSALLLVLAVLLVIINAFVWHTFLALAFSHRRVQAAYVRSRKVIGRTAGILSGVFGMRLLITAAGQLRPR